uniref:UBP-type domain-containing protein n=2 Tax=Trieres chinensis TaxID=1514140 RepID=A0A6U1UMB0_TRICV
METTEAEATIERLVTVFGFSPERSRRAVDAIGDKSDVQAAYNWLLDRGEEDRGGPVDVRICDHASAADDNPGSSLIDPSEIDADALKSPRCAGGCDTDEVWMCLGCGKVGCGRYVNGHGIGHFNKTLAAEEAALTVSEASKGKTALGHYAAIGLRDLSVWCYHCQSYVTSPRIERLVKRCEEIKFGEKKTGEGGMEVEKSDDESPALEKGGAMKDVPWKSMHGFMGSPDWDPPVIATVCDSEARPGYRTMRAHEYLDTQRTLRAKVALLASWIRKARSAVVYSGAGISTAAGIGDYASVADDSVARTGTKLKLLPMTASPTLSHCVVTQLHAAGLIHHWIQQNHDGLPQKAGFPQQHINEIHGAWYDVSNPVVPMSGTLRSDLMEWLLEWEQKADLCIAVGSSLCGMNADRVVTTTARKARSGAGFGSAIVSLQRTQLDDLASLRIFASCDDVFDLLASELGVRTGPIPIEIRDFPENDVFLNLPYSSQDGRRTEGEKMTLDLRIGKSVKVVNQPEWDSKRIGNVALVVGKNAEGDFLLNFDGRKTRTLGRWWLMHAMKGEIPRIPVLNLN